MCTYLSNAIICSTYFDKILIQIYSDGSFAAYSFKLFLHIGNFIYAQGIHTLHIAIIINKFSCMTVANFTNAFYRLYT